MQVIFPAPASPARRVGLSVITGSLVGAVLLGGGVVLGWLMLGTSFISTFTPSGRAEPGEMILGAVAWSVALIAPAVFLIVGVARIAAVVETVAARRPRPTPAVRLASELGDEYVVAARPILPDGRPVPELVLGPFGAAVIAELPSPRITRRRGPLWEVRGPNGWLALENPLDRAARDAERVRRWFASADQDFLVKVYAAVVATDPSITRTATCAVVAPEAVAAWLRSLPAQRSLTESRRGRLVERLRERA